MTPALVVICAWQTFNALVLVGGVWLVLRKAEAGVVRITVARPARPKNTGGTT